MSLTQRAGLFQEHSLQTHPCEDSVCTQSREGNPVPSTVRAPTGEHVSPLQYYRMGTGSIKISLSSADSKVPVEASKWPAPVLNLPGRAGTHSEERPGTRGARPPAGLGCKGHAQSQALGPLPSQEPPQRQEQRSLQLPHGQSRAARTMQAVRGTEPECNGGDTRPRRRPGESSICREHEESKSHL